jgi:hypothetical protein
MEAELLDRLGFRLAPTGIDASRRAPAMLRLLLDEMEKGSGLDADALAARLGEHFVDGTTNVLVTDLETGAPFAVGAEQRRAMAEHIVAAGRIDAQTVRGALVAAFPPAAGDEQGLELEASQVLQSIDRPDTAAAAGKDPLPPFVRGWAQVEASSPDAAYAAGEEMLAAAAELRHGGVALPAGDGVLLDVRAGGMPLASASVRGATVRSLATGFLFAAGFLLVLWTCVLLLGSGTAYDPRDPRCAVRATGSRQGWRELSRCLSDAVPLALVPLAACSFALGGAAFLRLPFDPGATATLAVALTLGGAIGVLLVLPWTRFAAVPPESRAAARRVALHLGPALAAACLALSLIPLPPARTMGLVLAASILAAAGLGAAHAGRGSPG